jgi:ADP-heptose:LPS heptosyltransferase
MVMLTPVLRSLKSEGWHITLFTHKSAYEVVKHNPNIDAVEFYQNPENDKEPQWAQVEAIQDKYDKVINLSGHIEEKLLVVPGKRGWDWSHEKRHAACDLNYVQNQLTIIEHPLDSTACELHFTPLEHSEAKRFMKKFSGKFVIMWSLTGSAFHKVYPYAEYVAMALMAKYPDLWIFTVGDLMSSMLEWRHERTKNYCDKWPIRKSMLLTKYVQCVVGPETGILNAASCYDTPKVIFLSHSSHENLSRDWINVTPVEALDCHCHPCHKLISNLEDCPLERGIRAPMCMARIKPIIVFEAIEKEYLKWKEKRA